MAVTAGLVYLFISSFVLSLVFIPLTRALARRYQLVDRPDGHRKLHIRTIPLAGGLGIFLAVSTTLACWLWLADSAQTTLGANPALLLGLLLACTVLCLAGVADDYGCLRVRHKLLGQMLAVTIMLAFGVQIQHVRLFRWEIELGLLALPFTGFLLLAAINALNLLDGMDGLLGSLALVTSAGIAVLALVNGQWTAAWVAVATAGALVGFLLFNLPPASVFLGDTGSMLIGLVVGVLAIQSTLKGPATVGLTTLLALLTIPAFDTTAAIARRKLTGRRLYTTDRAHLHHCLQRQGLSKIRVLLLVACLCLVTMGGALGSVYYNNDLLALLSSLAVVGTLVGTRLFGHAEAGLIQKRLQSLLHSLFTPRSHRDPRQVEIRLQGSVRWQDFWNRLTECAEDLQLKSLRLDVNAPFLGEGYHARWDDWHDREEETLWRTDIPLVVKGRTVGSVQILGERDHLCVSEKVAVIGLVVEEIEAMVVSLAAQKSLALGSGPHKVLEREEVKVRAKKKVFVDADDETMREDASPSPSPVPFPAAARVDVLSRKTPPPPPRERVG